MQRSLLRINGVIETQDNSEKKALNGLFSCETDWTICSSAGQIGVENALSDLPMMHVQTTERGNKVGKQSKE